MLKAHGKTIATFIVAVIVALWPQLTGNHAVDLAEGIAIATAIVGAAVTYLIPLAPDRPWLKTAAFAVTAGLGVAATVAPDGITGDELLLILGAVASALGVWVAPAASSNGVAVGWGADR